MKNIKLSGKFVFEPPKTNPVGSVLYNEHLKLVEKSRLADFAGYLMPLWYSSISEEHQAVRQKAGLFDCTHMGVLEIAGADAADFLNLIATNDVSLLKDGMAQYSYILDAEGNVLDDIIIYRRSGKKFLVVVNASNEPKIKAYLNALQAGLVVIDITNPTQSLKYKPSIRDMRDTTTDNDCRVDIALQGPVSTEVLSAMVKDSNTKKQIENLKSFHFIQADIAGIDCIISRTGYTGAIVSYELFVHPVKAGALWNILLEKGKLFGLIPCGLGARDSLRVEAGLPLYGHELDGEFNITPFEAGYGWAVKLQKEFFIGKAAMEKNAASYDMRVVRIELPGEKGIRPARQKDAVLKNDKCIGWILSCAKAGEKQYALAYVAKDAINEGEDSGIYYLARSESQIKQGKKQSVEKGQQVSADIKGKVVTRFAKF